MKFAYVVQRYAVNSGKWHDLVQPENGMTPQQYFKHLCWTERSEVYRLVSQVIR